MEKRKGLFRRKSSEKIPGETESLGSLSSRSERCSDDKQEAFNASPNSDTQSAEVTSKPLAGVDDVSDTVKILTEKLSAALVNISAKDELVKQHAKVAEEAVAGWEKAENEAAVLKERLEAAVQRNSTLEDQVNHLDDALKECVGQLRQGREEHEQNIFEAFLKRTLELETTKSELENHLIELKREVKVKSDPTDQADLKLLPKLESLERENSTLKLEVQTLSEELHIKTIERDLSTQAAEIASKQHLESIKKVTRLEAECRRLKAVASKSIVAIDNKSVASSSVCVESILDTQLDSRDWLNAIERETCKMSSTELNSSEPTGSESWTSALIVELDQFKNHKVIDRRPASSSIEIDLMNDFLEMERLAALPNNNSGSYCHELDDVAKSNSESISGTDMEAMTQRAAELEEKLERLEAEKNELEVALTKSHGAIMASERRLKEAEMKLDEVQRELSQVNDLKQFIESQLINMDAEARTLSEKVDSLESEVEKERAISAELAMKCQRSQEEELGRLEAEKTELEMSLTRSHIEIKESELRLKEAEIKLEEVQRELSKANDLKTFIESQLLNMDAEAHTLSTKVDSLESEVEKERSTSAEIAIKYQKLEEELARRKCEAESKVEKERSISAEMGIRCQKLEGELAAVKHEAELQKLAKSNNQLKIKQEGLAVAAGKFSECQKTMASIGNQLKSLATLEDFLIDTTNLPEFAGGPAVSRANGDLWKSHSDENFSIKRDFGSFRMSGMYSETPSKNDKNLYSSPSSSSLATSSNRASSEKNRNGFANFFSRTKNGIQLEI